MLTKIERSAQPGDPHYVWTSWAEYQEYRNAQPVDVERLRSLPGYRCRDRWGDLMDLSDDDWFSLVDESAAMRENASPAPNAF